MIDLAPYLLLGIAVVGLIVVWLQGRQARRRLADSELYRAEQAAGEQRVHDFLHHLGHSISQDSTRQHLYQVITEGVQKVTQSAGAALYLIDYETGTLLPAHLTADCAQLVLDPMTDDPDKVARLLRREPVSLTAGVLGDALRQQEPLIIPDLAAQPSLAEASRPYSGQGAAMLAPLVHAEQLIGVLAVTVSRGEAQQYSAKALYLFSQLAEQSSFALGNLDAHHQAEQKKRMEAELENAKEVQRVLIPTQAPDVPGLAFYGYNLAAQKVSGDYFDYTAVSDNSTGVVIADVSGKGMAAGLIMATFRSALKAIAGLSASPAESLSQLNKMVYPDIRDDMFISAIYAHLDHDSGRVTLARAGHNPAYYYDAARQEIHKVKPPGLAVGIDSGEIFQSIIQDHELTLAPGDKLLLYTDGIIEAHNKHKDEFSSQRLVDFLQAQATLPARALGKAILAEIADFVQEAPQSDDITLVVIERLPV